MSTLQIHWKGDRPAQRRPIYCLYYCAEAQHIDSQGVHFVSAFAPPLDVDSLAVGANPLAYVAQLGTNFPSKMVTSGAKLRHL